MVNDLKLTRTNLAKLIDWPYSKSNLLKKDEVINQIIQHIENHDIGVFEYGSGQLSHLWALMINEKEATIYRTPNKNNEFIEYRLRQYNEYYLINNEAGINSKLADAILEGEFTWAIDIDNAMVSSKNDKVFLSVEKDNQMEVIELKDGKIYTDESFKYLLSEEAEELFEFIRSNSHESKYSYEPGINLIYLHEDYLSQPFEDVSEIFNHISDENHANRTIIFDNISRGMTNGQAYQILLGVREGLDVTAYADSSYDYKQMHNIRLGMTNDIPYEMYLDPSIEADKMHVFREALESGVPAEIVAELIEKNDYRVMNVDELITAMDDALDYNSDDLTYYISVNSGRETEERHTLYQYEAVVDKWNQLGNTNKHLAIHNTDIHDHENKPVIIMDSFNGKERLRLNQAYKEELGIDKLSESPSYKLINKLEDRLVDDFKINRDSVHGERSIKDLSQEKLNSFQNITETLEKGVKDIYESGKYQSYLDTVSRFHNYSLNNQILIYIQNPNATYVKGYGNRKTAKGGWFDLGRQVKRGEKAIKILAPMFITEKYKGELFKTIIKKLENLEAYSIPNSKFAILKNNNNTYSIAYNGLVSSDKLTRNQLKEYLDKKIVGKEICGFKPVNVFDISQCVIRKVKNQEGVLVNDPRSEKAVLSLSGEINNTAPEKMNLLFDVLRTISERRGVPVNTESLSGSNGLYDLKNKRIVIRDSLNESHKVKTAIHEIAHSRLHNDLSMLKQEPDTKSLRAEWEVQAESIAYVVSKELGLDTSDYSFGYIAGWSSGKELEELQKSMDIISKESKKLINDIDKELKSRNLDRTVLVEKESELNSEIDLTEVYKEEPYKAFVSLKDSSKHEEMSTLSDSDLYFMANSKYIRERYSSSLKHTPDKFVGKALEQLKKAKSIDNYSERPIVEISFCENVFDKPLFEDGQILDIREADKHYQKAERLIREEREKDKDNKYPNMKCYATVYAPIELENQKSLAVVHTKTSIGDGAQIGLIDALRNSNKLNEFNADVKKEIINAISFKDDKYKEKQDIKTTVGIDSTKEKIEEYKKTSIKGNSNNAVNKKQKSKEEVII